ncbi:YggS family pyridoxal phosphate-dependent enzyme [Sphingomonas astaxanthinifaciens]|uniref:Pyridoxal phosphate homeostasis protein n=1 Tax=Sphingomonas astaxanthinifaciens DSM 22298 TaxID=1123267 RepID=A0ABQ5Z5L6_9SPHN|nr:YggS family pyridoxal phosphate-dependent enzyme [Sphingomonas astaxanthinifaciens]GLR46782.1 YggS family pyridoxal phosphate enzyme [Sphingomonas astaxanthinifaciens DSM 22298]
MSDAATRLAAVRATIDQAAHVAGRKPEDVTLVAVSKNRPAEAIEELIAAGQRDFGESRVQEAMAKWPDLRDRHPDIRLHMIGRLQSNKAKEAAGLFDVIHSLDRASLRDALVEAGWSGPTYVQVNIGEEEQKGGVPLAELPAFLAALRDTPLAFAGLMGIPPAGVEASPYFALLAKLARRHDVTRLSMGMSGDLRSAVMLGATVVRVGTALFED